MEGTLLGQNPDPTNYLMRVKVSPPGHLFQDPTLSEYPYKDLEYCLDINRFDFIMPISREGGQLLMKAAE